MTISQAVEKAVQDELGANRVEIIKLRAVIASHRAEITRLGEELEKMKSGAPELPLAPAMPKGAANGAHH